MVLQALRPLEKTPQKFPVFPVAIASEFGHIGAACGESRVSGCSSGVEHNLAKVGVERSNRFTRSKSSNIEKPRFAAAFVFSGG